MRFGGQGSVILDCSLLAGDVRMGEMGWGRECDL